MSEEKMREAFERVVESKFGFDDNDFYFDETDSTYNDPDLNDLWIVYQAALQESEAGAVGGKYRVEIENCGITHVAYVDDLEFGKAIVDAFVAPPFAQAIETAAIMKCVEVVRGNLGLMNGMPLSIEMLLALIPQDGRTQLASFTERAVAAGMNAANEFYYGKSEEVSSSDIAERLVTNLIGAAK